MRHRKQTGFTIVELLIVIVVIGILAAITIVAYRGIQQRATAAALTSAAEQSVKLMEAYKAINDHYPSVTAQSCVGDSYPATSLMPANSCWSSRDTTTGALSTTTYTNPSLIAALAEFNQSKLNLTMAESVKSLPWWPSTRALSVRGIIYRLDDYTDTKPTTATIQYDFRTTSHSCAFDDGIITESAGGSQMLYSCGISLGEQ